jgi:hypothetical protein
MGDALRRLFLSLGVVLGIATGQPDPSLFAHAALVNGTLVVSARIENAFAPGTIDLIETGTRVALRYAVKGEGSGGRGIEKSETRVIWYDLRSARYCVSFGDGKTAALVDPRAARDLASELRGLEIHPAAEADALLTWETRLVVRAEIGIVNARGEWHDAPVLWNYSSPRASFALEAGEEGGR